MSDTAHLNRPDRALIAVIVGSKAVFDAHVVLEAGRRLGALLFVHELFLVHWWLLGRVQGLATADRFIDVHLDAVDDIFV